jgi:hypothetical protein
MHECAKALQVKNHFSIASILRPIRQQLHASEEA